LAAPKAYAALRALLVSCVVALLAAREVERLELDFLFG